MILPDFEIARMCLGGLVSPFDSTLINPASLDVRLGKQLLIEQEDKRGLMPFDISNYNVDTPFLLDPDEFILAHTVEKFNVPDDVAGQFALKSSVARSGVEHLMAGYIDPGFTNSVLTLELKNARRNHPVFLWPGMRIGQIVWQRMSAPPTTSYRISGRYNNDQSVTPSKGLY
jgi:dCTP deaminase